MKAENEEGPYNPSFRHSVVTFLTIIIVISAGLFYLHASLHSLMSICLVAAGISAWRMSKNGFHSIRKAMNKGLEGGFAVFYIFLLIGVLIAALIQSGALATLIYYGVQFIPPACFLPGGLVLCSLMSMATGTSWGTAGTIGLVLVSIGSAMNIPAPLVAGMVVSGAFFGDKMSPISDSTNLTAMSSGTDLYTHIRSMAYTTTPAYFIALIAFFYFGLEFANSPPPQNDLDGLLNAIESLYSVGVISLLPLAVMLVMSLKRVPAEPTMVASAIVATLIAILVQGKSLTGVLDALYSGQAHHSSVPLLNELLGRGGLTSMMWTLSLSLLALALGGILEGFGFVRVLVAGTLSRIERKSSLVAMTVISCLMGNVALGELYVTIILGGRLFGDTYDELAVDRSVLSRTIEEGGTFTTGLIPWTTAGAFLSSALGVQVLDYAPWALLNWINPLLSIVFAYAGIALFEKGKFTAAQGGRLHPIDADR